LEIRGFQGMSEANLSGIDWNNNEVVVRAYHPSIEVFGPGSDGYHCALRGVWFAYGNLLCNMWKNARQHSEVQAFERLYNPAFQQSGMTSEALVKIQVPDAYLSQDVLVRFELWVVTSESLGGRIIGCGSNGKEAWDDAASKLPPVPASPEKGEEAALPDFVAGHGYPICDCDLEGGDEDCKIVPAYQSPLQQREAQLLSALQRVRELEGVLVSLMPYINEMSTEAYHRFPTHCHAVFTKLTVAELAELKGEK
jgi:hypothetical protein